MIVIANAGGKENFKERNPALEICEFLFATCGAIPEARKRVRAFIMGF